MDPNPWLYEDVQRVQKPIVVVNRDPPGDLEVLKALVRIYRETYRVSSES